MKTTIQAHQLQPGMLFGRLKIRRVTAVKRVANGDVYFSFDTLGVFIKTMRVTARTKFSVLA